LRFSHRCVAASSLVHNAAQHYIAIIRLKGGTKMDATHDRKEMNMNIARAYNNWVKYRQTVNELGRMTNRELGDLGIAREDIRKVARQAVR
jgi:uncharacterized protein YjiS (DUF1127 family)